jgi:nucleoid-associated protein YgaU
MFDQKGIPLRAKGSATFIQSINSELRESLKKKNSPDLTHIRVVEAGDNLPLMCHRIYGDPAFYVQVARANKLENLMTLEPGRRIYFPPLEK